MAWKTVDLDVRRGGSGRRAASEIVVHLHPTGSVVGNLIFFLAPRLVEAGGFASLGHRVEIQIDADLGILRIAPRAVSRRKLRPPGNGRGRRWALNASYRAEMRDLFPVALFRESKTFPLRLVELSSEGITVELPALKGGGVS